MNPSFTVFVDESGDEGFTDKPGASAWFVLSAVAVRTVTELETVRLVEEVRQALEKPSREKLHFRDLKHEQKLVYVGRIARAHLRAVSILIHKPSIFRPEVFRERYRLYFYSVRYLLERVSWLCKKSVRSGEGDGTAKIIFSNRAGMKYEEMRDYLRKLEAKSKDPSEDIRIDWSVIRCDQVIAEGRNLMGLQVADAVAGSFFRGLEPQRGYIEPRYASMLAPIVYRSGGTYIGCGVKLWPVKLRPLVEKDERLRWLLEIYDKK